VLRERFPRLHLLETTRIGSHGLLFRWAGARSGRPVVLMAHSDVVPVEGEWRHPPFGAVVEDGAIWGHGTLDCKGSLVAICQAVEDLLAAGHTPGQDVWLSFGCNEEVAGDAAPLAVEELRRRGVTPWFVLDEGGAVAHDAFPGVDKPIAVIGVTEKGITSLELRVDGRGGHASTSAPLGPTAHLARAVTRLDRAPMRASAPDATMELFRRAAPHAKPPHAVRVEHRRPQPRPADPPVTGGRSRDGGGGRTASRSSATLRRPGCTAEPGTPTRVPSCGSPVGAGHHAGPARRPVW
jgi:carboxypeptidase PM20D1